MSVTGQYYGTTFSNSETDFARKSAFLSNHAGTPVQQLLKMGMTTSSDDFLERASALHRRAVVLDCHCDTTQRLLDPDWDFGEKHDIWHVDIPRLREGGVSAVVLAVYAGKPADPKDGVAAARAQLDRIDETVERHKDSLVLARTQEDVRSAKRGGRIAVLIGIEGGYLIADSLEVLREFRERGAIYMTLTHAFHTTWADSSGVHEPLPPLHGGLTDFGREVVREMNRIGMIVDVSHVSDETFWDVLDTSSAPPIASHSSCRAVSPHRRNLSDDMIRALAGRGGVIQINFAAAFVDPDFPELDPKTANDWWERGGFTNGPLTDHVTPLDVLVNHFDHALRLVGPEHVGIGSDFDGVGALPRGMEDCSRLPYLTAALLRRGYSENDLEKVLGGNLLRVMEECQRTAQKTG